MSWECSAVVLLPKGFQLCHGWKMSSITPGYLHGIISDDHKEHLGIICTDGSLRKILCMYFSFIEVKLPSSAILWWRILMWTIVYLLPHPWYNMCSLMVLWGVRLFHVVNRWTLCRIHRKRFNDLSSFQALVASFAK